ncbi:MAG TPA: serine hydrolase [Candidatus Nanoarchaeia archaeon]|nr:serine hydrolase [Candidatus Nanoarchaeia archaeon]
MDSYATQQKKEKALIAAGAVALVLLVLMVLFIYSRGPYTRPDEIGIPVVRTPKQMVITADVQLSAKAAVVWDMRRKKVVYEKNQDEVMPLASLAKLMTALTASELLPENSTVRITRSNLLNNEEKDELLPNETWKAQNLLALTLLSSSNAGAKAVASAAGAFLPRNTAIDPRVAFLQNLNTQAVKLGMNSTHFFNESGLDVDKTQSGAYGTAKDVAILMDYIIRNHPELLEPTTNDRLLIPSEIVTHNVKNTNIAIENIPGALGSKTGYTDLAQGNLAVAFSPGLEGPYIAVVLGSTYEGRFTDIDQLIDATINATRK